MGVEKSAGARWPYVVLIVLVVVCATGFNLLLLTREKLCTIDAEKEIVRADMTAYMNTTQRLELFPGTKILYRETDDNCLALKGPGGVLYEHGLLTGFDTCVYHHIDISQTAFPSGTPEYRRAKLAAIVRDLAIQIRDEHGDCTVSIADASPHVARLLSSWALIRFRHGVTVVTVAYAEARRQEGGPQAIGEEVRVTIVRSHRIDHSLPGISYLSGPREVPVVSPGAVR